MIISSDINLPTTSLSVRVFSLKVNGPEDTLTLLNILLNYKKHCPGSDPIMQHLRANNFQTSSIINQIDLLCMNKSLPASVTQTRTHTHPTFKYMTWWEFGIAHFVVAHALIK